MLALQHRLAEAADRRRIGVVPVRGVIVTARASMPGFDFVSRFFAPGSGIDEDPVTGSAHTALGPYWSKLLGKTPTIRLFGWVEPGTP